ncbi:MAG: FAD-binding protein [Thermoplasmata archaeon]
MEAGGLDGIRLLTSSLEREIYSLDQAEVPAELRRLFVRKRPQLIAQPRSEEEIARVLRYADGRDLPVVPRGAASSPYGGALPVRGGIVLDLSLLRTIVAFDPEAGVVTVEGGVRWADLDQFLAGNDYALRSHPTSWWSTVAGWLSTGGYGLYSLGFGPFASQVAWIRVVDFTGTHTLAGGDEAFRYYAHTEGQMGVVSQLGVSVRPRPAAQHPLLFAYPGAGVAVAAAESIAKAFEPVHMTVYDPHRLGELNALQGREVLEKADSVLVVTEDEREAEGIADVGGTQAEPYQASFLWEHRFFPMQVKRLGPGILGAETLLPLSSIPRYLAKAEALAERFGASLAHETHLVSPKEGLLISSFLTDPGDLERYLPHMVLVLLLHKAGIRAGGRAYGLGVWNRPFLRTRYARRDIRAYRAYKRHVDPKGLLNPGKAFDPGADPFPPAWSLTPFLLSPLIVRAVGRLLPRIRMGGPPAQVLRELAPPGLEGPTEEDLRSAAECAHCGACITVCPAYLADKTELVTARGKLLAMEKMARGEAMEREEAWKLFDCIHCSACTNVCQSAIDLVPVWDRLEHLVADRYGKPRDRIEAFAKRVEAEEEYHDLVNRGLAYPIQTPRGRHRDV